MEERSYSSTVLDIYYEWWRVVSFTLRLLYPSEKSSGGWVETRVDLDAVR
jgi:hypothetical protein